MRSYDHKYLAQSITLKMKKLILLDPPKPTQNKRIRKRVKRINYNELRNIRFPNINEKPTKSRRRKAKIKQEDIIIHKVQLKRVASDGQIDGDYIDKKRNSQATPYLRKNTRLAKRQIQAKNYSTLVRNIMKH